MEFHQTFYTGAVVYPCGDKEASAPSLTMLWNTSYVPNKSTNHVSENSS